MKKPQKRIGTALDQPKQLRKVVKAGPKKPPSAKTVLTGYGDPKA
jgi:hypothetical protein